MAFPNVIVIDHPVVQTKLAELRDFTADRRRFRSLLDEIAKALPHVCPEDLVPFSHASVHRGHRA